jgi:hypothetical protein
MSRVYARRRFAVTALAASMSIVSQQRSIAQTASASAQSTHVTIPFLANATKPADLDFQGGECERDAGGTTLACVFQQVFLTTSPLAPDTCLITTSGYERTFRRDTPTRWISTEGPEGICGVLDVATLLDEGGVKWTLEMHKVATKKNAATCQAIDGQPEALSWQNMRRPLPCRFVQPGSLGR